MPATTQAQRDLIGEALRIAHDGILPIQLRREFGREAAECEHAEDWRGLARLVREARAEWARP